MSQIAGNLMLVAPIVLDYVWGDLNILIRNLPDEAFISHPKKPDLATKLREWLLHFDDEAFASVRRGLYHKAKARLEKLKERVTDWIVVEANQAAVIAKIDEAIAKLVALPD